MTSVTLRKIVRRLRGAGLRSVIKYGWWNVTGLVKAMRSVPGQRFKDCQSLVDFSFDTASGFIRPIQVRSEILALIKILAAHRPRYVLEIGTANGGSLFLFTRIAADDAHIVSVDLPCGEFGDGYPLWKIPLYRSLPLPGQRLDLVRADSHAQPTRDRVESLLAGNLLDFIFIDADHTYAGVKRDFEMYMPLLRRGGIIAFHDIAPHPDPSYGVRRFWNEIKGGFEHREFMDSADGRFGIGVLFLPT